MKALTGKFGGVRVSSKCPACDKTAYAAEAVDVDGAKYHRHCLRCRECSCSLSLTTMVQCEGRLWCARDAPRNRNTKHMDGNSMEIRGAVEAQKLAHDAMSSPDAVARYSTSSSSSVPVRGDPPPAPIESAPERRLSADVPL